MTTLVNSQSLNAAVGQMQKEVDKRIVSAREDLAKIDETSGFLNNYHLPHAVRRFAGFIETEEDEDGDYVFPDITFETSTAAQDFEIYYHAGLNTFIAKKETDAQNGQAVPGGIKWYKSFAGMYDYVVAPGGEPRKDVIFLQVEIHESYDGYWHRFSECSFYFYDEESKNEVYNGKLALAYNDLDSNWETAKFKTWSKKMEQALSDLDNRTAKLDKNTGKVLQDQLPFPVVSFHDVEKLNTLTIEQQSVTGAVEVIFYSKNQTFVAKKDGKYYNNWDTRDQFMPKDGNRPYKDRLFQCFVTDDLYYYDGMWRRATFFSDYVKKTDLSYMTEDDAVNMVKNAFK